MAFTPDAKYLLYIGSYASPLEPGIHVLSYDPISHQANGIQKVTGLENPSYVAVGPTSKHLYAVSEGSQPPGQAAVYSIEPDTGCLTLQNQKAIPDGSPCHVSVDNAETVVLCANYTGGNISIFPLDENKNLGDMCCQIQHVGHGVRPDRQEAPHPHSTFIHQGSQYVLVPDLGLDKVMIYQLERASHSLKKHGWYQTKPGSGPRLLAFDGITSRGYLIEELTSTIAVLSFHADNGTLAEIQNVSTLPEAFTGENTAAHIELGNGGKYLYASNRGHDSIAVYRVCAETGELSLIQHAPTLGKTPRHFALAPDFKTLFVANQDSNNITVFGIDDHTGTLSVQCVIDGISHPSCVAVFGISK